MDVFVVLVALSLVGTYLWTLRYERHEPPR